MRFTEEALLVLNQEYVATGGEPFDFSPQGASEADNEWLREQAERYWETRTFSPWS